MQQKKTNKIIIIIYLLVYSCREQNNVLTGTNVCILLLLHPRNIYGSKKKSSSTPHNFNQFTLKSKDRVISLWKHRIPSFIQTSLQKCSRRFEYHRKIQPKFSVYISNCFLNFSHSKTWKMFHRYKYQNPHLTPPSATKYPHNTEPLVRD